MKKTILITGSNGLLGQKLVELLLSDPKIRVIATAFGNNRLKLDKSFIYEEMDITNQQQVEQVFEKYTPNTVINTAAMTNVDACEDDKAKCDLLNITAVKYLLEACKKHSCHFIHLSTDFVFDGKAGPYRETDQPKPLSYYGRSKHMAEELVIKSGLENWAIARTILVYGIIQNASRSNVVLWAKAALAKGEPMNVVDDQFRSPTLSEDLAMGCALIAKQEARGIYHLSGQDQLSIVELVHRVAKFWKLDASNMATIKSSTLNQAAKRPPVTGFILDKARKDLGYAPHTFEEGLAIMQKQIGVAEQG